MITVNHPLALASTFLWVGFVCAISFMEAWLKFRAPGVTLPIGLGIGRLVFNVLNKIEWLFVFSIIISLSTNSFRGVGFDFTFIVLPIVLLIVQTLWLLPALDGRAQMHINGTPPPSSNLHFYFVGVEVLKVIMLLIWGVKLFKFNPTT